MRQAPGRSLRIAALAGLGIVASISACGGGGAEDGGVTPPSNLAYSTNPATYTKGVAIAPNTPSSNASSRWSSPS